MSLVYIVSFRRSGLYIETLCKNKQTNKQTNKKQKKLAIPKSDKISSFVEKHLEAESDSFYLR